MADNGTFFSAYPGIMQTGDNDGDSHRAVLVSHSAASVERNQDAQFSAGRDLQLTREVVGGTKDARIESLTNRYELATAIKDLEIRQLERDAGIRAELAAMRAEGLQRDVAELRAGAQASVTAQLLELVKGLTAKA
ncbi:MAG TPA: hypothetical protein VKD72_01385 [Gemmataceae bacterium]|nr:hypothetical protein [Gemmataceae bacterium]